MSVSIVCVSVSHRQRWVKYSKVQVQVQVLKHQVQLQVPLPYNPVQVQVRKLEFKKMHSETIILKKTIKPNCAIKMH